MYTRRGKKQSYINDDFPDKLGYFGVISIIDSCHRQIGNLRFFLLVHFVYTSAIVLSNKLGCC